MKRRFETFPEFSKAVRDGEIRGGTRVTVKYHPRDSKEPATKSGSVKRVMKDATDKSLFFMSDGGRRYRVRAWNIERHGVTVGHLRWIEIENDES